MKTKSIWTLIAASAAGMLSAPTDLVAQNRELGSGGELLDRVVALVDEGIVLGSELEERIEIVVQNFQEQQRQLPPQQRGQLPPLSVLEEQVLEQLIIKEIQLQRAERLGIQVGDDMLNQALSSVAQNLGFTLNELPSALAQEGIDYATYRESSREELIINQLEQRDVMNRISITPREMELCLERQAATEGERLDYNVSHILVSMPNSATPEQIAEAEAQVDEIYERLEAGDDFAQLALTYSDAQTALDGGALGWREGSELPTLFADIVIGRMEAGDVADPIRSGSGFHIVKLNDVRGAEPVMVDQLRVRHILLRPNELLDDDATRQKLIGIRQQIAGGDEFGTLAISQSEDTVSAADGGDLGWVEPGQFVPEFEEKLTEIDIGEVSEPFQTRYGWHIVEITDERSHDTTEERQRQQCEEQIRQSKAQEEREMWLRRLRDQAYVEVRR